MTEKKDIQSSPIQLLLGETMATRRGFFTSAIVLAGAAALAGCGGGGGGDRWNSGTYRNYGSGNQATVSVSIDRDGLLTFWVLFSNDQVADYGQSYVDNDGYFEQNFGGYHTYGRARGNRIEGRTELSNDASDGFDWDADRYNPSSFSRPGSDLEGTFNGFSRVNGVDYTTFLTITPDGSATVFSELDLPSTNDVDELLFEGVSFNRDGNVPNNGEYFLSLFDDTFAVRPSGNSDVRLIITFGSSVPNVGLNAGDVVELVLDRQNINDVRSHRAATTERKINPAALERIFTALKEGRKVKS
jgi:hypothetical protein